MSFPTIQRIVTGHDADGRAVIVSQGPLPTVVEIAAIPGTVFHEVWSTSGNPVPIDNGADPTVGALMLPPPKQGTRFRFVDIPPDTSGSWRVARPGCRKRSPRWAMHMHLPCAPIRRIR